MLQDLQEEFGLTQSPDLGQMLLKIPGAVTMQAGQAAGGEMERIERLLLEALDKALAALDVMRAQEARRVGSVAK